MTGRATCRERHSLRDRELGRERRRERERETESHRKRDRIEGKRHQDRWREKKLKTH